MASPGRGSNRRGADFERKICKWFADWLGVPAERVQAGRFTDGGDVTWKTSRYHIDCKSRKVVPLSMFDEVQAEGVDAGYVPLMLVDRAGRSDPGETLAVVRLQDLLPWFEA